MHAHINTFFEVHFFVQSFLKTHIDIWKCFQIYIHEYANISIHFRLTWLSRYTMVTIMYI
jgi:hypothetical protein